MKALIPIILASLLAACGGGAELVAACRTDAECAAFSAKYPYVYVSDKLQYRIFSDDADIERVQNQVCEDFGDQSIVIYRFKG